MSIGTLGSALNHSATMHNPDAQTLSCCLQDPHVSGRLQTSNLHFAPAVNKKFEQPRPKHTKRIAAKGKPKEHLPEYGVDALLNWGGDSYWRLTGRLAHEPVLVHTTHEDALLGNRVRPSR